MEGQMVGGTSKPNKATKDVQKLCDEVKHQVEQKAGKNFATYTATSYTTQVVAGTNFFVKLHVGGNDYIHVKIYKALPHTGEKPKVTAVQCSKTQHDAIEFF
ncbi:cystatin-B-like [Paramisgurnus dabryanus]|uniref:cystatin-B-like n=1 Tax=Paramisgurnus dabryanus TaxID=90735 RepID=UPI003CCF8865